MAILNRQTTILLSALLLVHVALLLHAFNPAVVRLPPHHYHPPAHLYLQTEQRLNPREELKNARKEYKTGFRREASNEKSHNHLLK
jgi:hypothetical protein